VQYNLGINCRNLGKLQESIDMFTKSIDHINNTDRSAAYNYRGLSNFEAGQFSDAQKDFKKAIEISNPKTAVHYNNRGLASYHMNLYE